MISSFKMALRSIGSNTMRAALTMLGIIIGVMALVVLVSLVNGATSTVTDEVSSLGSNYVDAYVWRQEVGSSLTINDLRKWAQENEYVEAVAPVNYGDAKGKAGSASDSISLYGTMPAFADINGLTIEYGRFLKNTDVDNSSRVCVLSKQAAEQDLENVRHGPHRVLHDTHGIDVEAVAVAEKVIEEFVDGCLGVGHFRALRRGDVKFGNRAAVLGVLPRE